MNPTQPAAIPPGPGDTKSVLHLGLTRYLDHLRVRAYADGTVRNASLYLHRLLAWLEANKVRAWPKVSRILLDGYQQVLLAHRKRDRQPLAVAGRHVRLTTVRGFFRWLTKEGYCETNPASDLELPKLGQRLPKRVLTEAEVERVLVVPALSTPTGLRDRALLELLYSTGIRRGELCGLHVGQIDQERGILIVRHGKGHKDRHVPLGRRALHWLRRYLSEARPLFSPRPSETALFLRRDGCQLTYGVAGQLVRSYIVRSSVGQTGSCHLFRHAMATHMLEGGADIRYIQQMLGHARLSTTEIYTHVTISQLLAVHKRTHPAERALLANPATDFHPRCPHCGRLIPSTLPPKAVP